MTRPAAAPLDFALTWSRRRREHQTRARSSHYWRRWLTHHPLHHPAADHQPPSPPSDQPPAYPPTGHSDDRHHDQPPELTDAQWAHLNPLLPPTPKPGRPHRDQRTIINALLVRLHTGCTWRDLPPSYGPWQTIHRYHQHWTANGTWTRILNTLGHQPAKHQADTGSEP